MEQIVAVLEEELPKYIHEVKSKPQENAKAFAFSSFIQRCFGIESQELDFEKSIKTEAMQMRGRIDAVFENIIIEFKKDLSSGLDVAKEELHKYFQSYLERSETNFLGIANDGIHFKVFYPIIEENKVVGVEEKDSINLEKSSAQQVFQWFDSYLFSTEKITPTSADIKRRFGLASPTFTSMQKKLEILFQKIESFKPAILKYQSWNKYLEVVYGDKLNEKALFFKHTYLSTLVKLIVHARISGVKPNNFDEIVPILFGNTFSQAGIRNFIEEDFFSWVLSLPIRKQASKLFSSLLNEVYVYDLEKIDEDVLKELYQELVDPDVRKLLGEFYTPDWLAESMIIEVFEKDPTKSVMDPSCGSGTFLFKIIQYKIKKLSEKGWSNQKILEHIVNNVIGFDVHPLAATIAKTNYLLALKDIINSRKGPISIPVYLSDSLKIPIKKMDLVTTTHTFEFDALNKKFEFPISVAGEIGKMDEVIEMLREYGQGLELKIEKSEEEKYDFDADAYIKNIGISFEKFLSAKNYDENEKSVLLRAFGTLNDLIKNHSDAIWPYVLRNMYKPVSVSIKKVDVVIGNPPWLGLNNMKNEEYQNYIIERSKHYLLVDKKKSQNVTALNLGTLFFCQCADQYLKDGGEIAFVMPQGVLFASQHENFLKFEKNPIEITQIYDLEKVTPLFRILSCVIFGKKGSNTKYPVLRYDVHGKLPTSNSNLTNAKSFLKFSKSEYAPAKRETSKSFYYEKFSQGATIFPRCFWFVDIIVDNFLGFNPENPHVESSENRDAKKPWDKIKLNGNIEKQFLVTTLLSKDIVPFGNLARRMIAVPLLFNDDIKLLSSYNQKEIMGTSFSKYLEKAEWNWNKHAPIKSRKNMTIYDRIDYQKDLTSQNPFHGYTVLYVKSATNLASCVVTNSEKYSFLINENKFEIQSFFADATTYFYTTDSEEEAYYLCSIFNSKTLNEKIKPFQSRGAFGGARDIHKLPLSFNIPKYDPRIRDHKELVDIGIQCSKKVKQHLPDKIKSSGPLRGKIREILENELSIIDKCVKKILEKKSGKTGSIT